MSIECWEKVKRIEARGFKETFHRKKCIENFPELKINLAIDFICKKAIIRAHIWRGFISASGEAMENNIVSKTFWKATRLNKKLRLNVGWPIEF